MSRADHASTALPDAMLDRSRHAVSTVVDARVDEMRIIAQAQGILMARHRISSSAATDLLERTASEDSTSVYSVAQALVKDLERTAGG